MVISVENGKIFTLPVYFSPQLTGSSWNWVSALEVKQEAQLMLTTGTMHLVVSQGHQT